MRKPKQHRTRSYTSRRRRSKSNSASTRPRNAKRRFAEMTAEFDEGQASNGVTAEKDSVAQNQFELSGYTSEQWTRCTANADAFFQERGKLKSNELPDVLENVPAQLPVCKHPKGFGKSAKRWSDAQSNMVLGFCGKCYRRIRFSSFYWQCFNLGTDEGPCDRPFLCGGCANSPMTRAEWKIHMDGPPSKKRKLN